MLSRQQYEQLIHNTYQKIQGISFGLASADNSVKVFSGLPCYNSYVATKNLYPSTVSTVILPRGMYGVEEKSRWKVGAYMTQAQINKRYEDEKVWAEQHKLQSLVAFFSDDSRFKDVVNLIYNHSYADWCSFEEFKALWTEKGLVLEHSLINNWCAATVMTLMMTFRDGYYYGHFFKNSGANSFADFQKAMAKSSSYFSLSARIPLFAEVFTLNPLKTDEQIKTIYTEEDVINCSAGSPKDLLTKRLCETDVWNNAVDVCVFVLHGRFTVSDIKFAEATKLLREREALCRDKYYRDYRNSLELLFKEERVKPECVEAYQTIKKELVA